MPKISILCPSFNHEKYVGFFIESALKQSFQDFELIIVDDCSSDKNVESIKKFQDKRITLIQHPYNQGINATINTCFEHSSGEIIVFCASDDMFAEDALEKIYQTFVEQEVDVVYPALHIIDKDNNATSFQFAPQMNKIKTRNEILHYMFLYDNCITSVGMSVRRESYAKIHPLPLAMCNNQDTQMHINLLLNNAKFYFLEQKVISYRVTYENISVNTKQDTLIRSFTLETESLMDTFLKFKDINLLQEVFKNEIEQTQIQPFVDTIPFFLGRMALESKNITKRYWGYHKIMNFYDKLENVEILHKRYNFTFKDYLQLAQFCANPIEKKYKKYKKLFNNVLVLYGISIVLFIAIIFLRSA